MIGWDEGVKQTQISQSKTKGVNHLDSARGLAGSRLGPARMGRVLKRKGG
jgi:hypothetical protein